MKPVTDLRGKMYGKLTVLAESSRNKFNKVTWWCLCECRRITEVIGGCLKNGYTSSCGCLKLEKLIQRNSTCKYGTTHGLSKHSLYSHWSAMKDRCSNHNRLDAIYYSGKGISVCDEWKDFLPFYDWSIKNGWENGLTIDRIDSNKNYCPSNCQWITQSENTKRMIMNRVNNE